MIKTLPLVVINGLSREAQVVGKITCEVTGCMWSDIKVWEDVEDITNINRVQYRCIRIGRRFYFTKL